VHYTSTGFFTQPRPTAVVIVAIHLLSVPDELPEKFVQWTRGVLCVMVNH